MRLPPAAALPQRRSRWLGGKASTLDLIMGTSGGLFELAADPMLVLCRTPAGCSGLVELGVLDEPRDFGDHHLRSLLGHLYLAVAQKLCAGSRHCS